LRISRGDLLVDLACRRVPERMLVAHRAIEPALCRLVAACCEMHIAELFVVALGGSRRRRKRERQSERKRGCSGEFEYRHLDGGHGVAPLSMTQREWVSGTDCLQSPWSRPSIAPNAAEVRLLTAVPRHPTVPPNERALTCAPKPLEDSMIRAFGLAA